MENCSFLYQVFSYGRKREAPIQTRGGESGLLRSTREHDLTGKLEYIGNKIDLQAIVLMDK
jgi:hypothetical protein